MSLNKMENSDLRMRSNTAVEVPNMAGTIHPFLNSGTSLIQTLSKEIAGVLSERQPKKILLFAVMNFICTIMLLLWCNSTNSMALTAYTYLTIFDICRLLTCLVSVWVKKQKPTAMYSFGYERFEVLAVFASTLLTQLGSLFIVKESVERMLQQPEIHTGRLMVGTSLGFFFHMLVTYSMDNAAFNHVVAASSSSWLQEHVADMSESLCSFIPGLSKLLLPRINPFALIAFAGGTALCIVYLLIDMNNYYAADTWAAVWIAMMTAGTMFPMTVYSGMILLQTTPSHIIGQLDKCLREASTLDGVLEFRHEHFWTLAFGTMVGSVHVRIRRDADEQMVLAHVANRLSNLISVLTVQIFKDDWTRPSTYRLLGETGVTYSGGVSNLPVRPLSTLPESTSPYSSLKPHSVTGANLPYPNVGIGAPIAAKILNASSAVKMGESGNSVTMHLNSDSNSSLTNAGHVPFAINTSFTNGPNSSQTSSQGKPNYTYVPPMSVASTVDSKLPGPGNSFPSSNVYDLTKLGPGRPLPSMLPKVGKTH